MHVGGRRRWKALAVELDESDEFKRPLNVLLTARSRIADSQLVWINCCVQQVLTGMSKNGGVTVPTIVHFDVPTDDPGRAKEFYERLFGWRFTAVPMPEPFFLIETTGPEGKPGLGGGLGVRGNPEQRITIYVGVPAVDEYLDKVAVQGGSVVLNKTAVPGWGYAAVCLDTEGNSFGLWEEDKDAR